MKRFIEIVHNMVEENNQGPEDITPHILVCIDSINGEVGGRIIKIQMEPLQALGAIDFLLEELKESREDILEKLKDKRKVVKQHSEFQELRAINKNALGALVIESLKDPNLAEKLGNISDTFALKMERIEKEFEKLKLINAPKEDFEKLSEQLQEIVDMLAADLKRFNLNSAEDIVNFQKKKGDDNKDTGSNFDGWKNIF